MVCLRETARRDSAHLLSKGGDARRDVPGGAKQGGDGRAVEVAGERDIRRHILARGLRPICLGQRCVASNDAQSKAHCGLTCNRQSASESWDGLRRCSESAHRVTAAPTRP